MMGRSGTGVKAIAQVAVLIAALLNTTAWGALEVVQSVPVETSLSIPGIRETQAVWLEMISSARTSLDLEQFYVSDQKGESLEPVLAAIRAAAARGVRVRLIVDSKFYSNYPDSVNELGKLAGCESRILDYSSRGGVQHAKYFIVDGRESFIGSQNFDWRALSHIHEVGVRVDDNQLNQGLQSVFERDWLAAKGQGPREDVLRDSFLAVSDLLLLASPRKDTPSGIDDTLAAILQLFQSAQRSIQIQVMEYSTKTYGQGQKSWRVLEEAIQKAAARGVQVQLLVDVSNVKKAKKDLQAVAKLKNVEVRTVTIPEFSAGKIDYARLIHSKYLIVDGTTSWVGSENWSESYFVNTRNVGVLIRDLTATGSLSWIFERVWTSPYASRF